jgi:hypothetical protein
MKKLQIAALLAVVLILTVVPIAFAQPPVAACPVGFELHHVGEHETHHDHHIGIKYDLNTDMKICVKHLSSGLHVHVDNVVR